MAKKRKVSRKSEPSGPREIDAKDARLTIRTYEDVANSEDEYYDNQDRIDFDDDDEPRSKRLKRQEREEAFLEVSDEEVFEEDDSDESEEEDHALPRSKGGKKSVTRGEDASEGEEQAGGEEEGDEGWWGSSKKEYYNADNIETEADALEEEAEARRLQAKKLAKMQEADFAFDEGEWLAPKEQTAEDKEVVTEVLKEVEVTEDMGPEERQKLLQARYPEFDYLVDEFRELRPLLATLQKEAEGKPARSLEVIKSWLLGCYVASLASYFAILTSPSRDGDGSAATLSPSELRDHEVMETLVECREAWLKVQQLRPAKTARSSTGMLSPPEDEDLEMLDAVPPPKKEKTKEKLSKAEIKASQKKAAEAARKAKAVEQSLADLSTLLKSTKKASKAATAPTASADVDVDDNRSDFGEEEALDARTAADKARRKKSLKFYTSQIVQKANRRAGAGHDAGGDMDIPYRERLRDRQARLNAEAERRGKKGSKFGADLGADDSDGNDAAVAKQVRGDEDEYYDMVAQKAQKKREDKAARYEALAQARKGDRVVETEQLGPDGKRQITYQIQKNKGLTPHRKKEVRNPRVKKRMKFEEKQKKLRSVKAVYKGGEGPGGYQGETSGIKTGLIKSVKL
ncbi:something about silencing protein 10 [Madurella fahalii]|uniref:Something about silencing protein 10 n=1 Tax=Madurella fahalii TaxID=1157608 RepID=A0ABQ0GQX0_9PEZI